MDSPTDPETIALTLDQKLGAKTGQNSVSKCHKCMYTDKTSRHQKQSGNKESVVKR